MGAEVDIANGLGIMNLFKNVKEVVPVILFSESNIGYTARGIKDMAFSMDKMIRNF
jgi:hypothetical protein